MPTQKWCCATKCNNFVFATLNNFYKYGWSAFQIPSGNGKVLCFCPDHQKLMQEEMEKKLLKQREGV